MNNTAQICFNLGLITGRVDNVLKSISCTHPHSQNSQELKEIKSSLLLLKDLIIEQHEIVLDITTDFGGDTYGYNR